MKLNFNDADIGKLFKEKRERLTTARRNLKAYFVGLDNIIDNVVDKITAWYLFPDIATRPLIINLWGMTGVGKTDLIRRLVKELGCSDKFMELQMCSTGSAGSWEKSLQSKLLRSDIDTGQPGILLLDEFQRFRTVDDDGKEIRDYLFQDLWALLSDGRFGLTASLKDSLMEILFNAMYDESLNQVRVKQVKKRKLRPEDGSRARQPRIPDDDDEDDDEMEESPFKRRYWGARNLKRLLDIDDDIKDIMQWSPEKLIETVTDVMENPESYREADYSKLLIFVSGNLDEAFRSAIKVSEADQDADLIREQTSRINLVTIKDALSKRFKPEQISRLGSIHIIYPSLSKANFEDIITKRVNTIESSVESTYGASILFADSIKKLIYDNGVFPAQGVRPLLSTIDDIYNTCLPPVLIEMLEKKEKEATLEFSDKTVIGHIGKPIKGKVEVPYEGVLDQIRSDRLKKIDGIYNTAVHEAGHTLVFAELFGLAPPVVSINLTSSHSSGITYLPKITHSKSSLFDDICVGFGGFCAEVMVFGDKYPSNGSWADIKQATRIAANSVRHYNFGDTLSYVLPITDREASQANTNVKETNQHIEKILAEQKDRCFEILSRKRSLLVEISDALIKNLSISGQQIADICNKFDVTCEVAPIGSDVIHGYKNTYNEYKKVTNTFASRNN